MINPVEGIVPVMLTPLTADDQLDLESLERLTEWYLANGADALFAVCQSSEMLFLTLDERIELARRVAQQTTGRVPVVASGHVSESLNDQEVELRRIAETGIDGLVLVTNRLDPTNAGTDAFRANLDRLMAKLPSDLPLGLYECPAPYRRLLSDDELSYCRDTGRFVTLKDVSCDLPTIRRRSALVKGSPLAIVNANAAIALAAMREGSRGFAGVFLNFCPDLYAWLYANHDRRSDLVVDLAAFLALAANAEALCYPRIAKLFQERLGNFTSDYSRAQPFDPHDKVWALEAILDHIATGSAQFRKRIATEGGVKGTRLEAGQGAS